MDAPLKDRFTRYLDAIQPTQAQRNLAKEELSFLEKRLREYITDDDPYKYVKALRSGSFAKATSLRREQSDDFDADIAVYVEQQDAGSSSTANLIAYVEKLTKRAYEKRTKRKPRFERHESCVRAVFDVTPKINIDIVPIVALDHKTIPNWGVLPKRDGSECHTSVTEHIDFVRHRNKPQHSVSFRKLVRLLKRWRNEKFPDSKLSSFALELILAKAYDEQERSITGEALPDLMLLTKWIVNHALESTICFADPRVPAPTVSHNDPVIVLDPINQDDNVTSGWTVGDRDLFLDRIDNLRDILRDAEIEAGDDPDIAMDFVQQAFSDFRSLSED